MIFNKLFKKYLIQEFIISPEIAEQYRVKADGSGVPMYLELVKDKVINEETTYRVLAEFLGLEYRFCQLSEINLKLVGKYPRDLLLEYEGVPFEIRDDVLVILGSNPFKIEEFSELLTQGCRKIEFIISPPKQMKLNLDYANNKIQQNEAMNEYVMLGMRLASGIDLSDFFRRFGVDFLERFGPVKKYAPDFVTLDDKNCRFTESGMLVSNFVLSDILTNLERVSDHCSNVASCIIEMVEHEDLDIHEYKNHLKEKGEFDKLYREFLAKYSIAKKEV